MANNFNYEWKIEERDVITHEEIEFITLSREKGVLDKENRHITKKVLAYINRAKGVIPGGIELMEKRGYNFYPLYHKKTA